MRQITLATMTAICTATALLATTAPTAAAAAATPVTCGMTVTTDVTLTRNLTCTGPGLTVGADGITIDLNGHTLAGSGATSTDNGIYASEHSGLRITGGTITGFRQAIELTYVEDVVLQRLRLVGNNPEPGTWDATLNIFGVTNADLLDSQIRQPASTAMDIYHARTMRVERLEASGRIYWNGSRSVTVAHSVFTDARIGLLDSTSAVEIRHNVLRRSSVGASQAGVTITDNRFVGPIGTAIGISLSNGPVIERNVISGATRGVDVDVPPVWDARIADNVFRDNDYGVVLVEEDLIGGNLLVSDNIFVGNRQAGIFFEAAKALPDGGPATVTRNRFVRNGHGGTDTDSAGRPINDGIHTNLPVGSPVTISENHTRLNADHGIEALPAGSVIDGGGNRSTGDPHGCAGVACA